MENEQEKATPENAEDVLDLDGEEQSDPKPKKEFSTEQKLARVERMREKYLKELGLDKPEPKKVEKTESKANPDEISLLKEKLDRQALRQAGITHPDDVELAKTLSKKMGVDMDEVIDDEVFKIKLEKLQTSRANVEATSNVKGSAGSSSAKNTAEYWIAKGVPPTAADVPDRATRGKIARAFLASAKNSKKFYNE